MKFHFCFLAILVSAVSFGQADFNSLIRNAKKMTLPYSTSDELKVKDADVITLNDIQKSFIIGKLREISPETVNKLGPSAFGTLDYEENSGFLDSDRIDQIAIICYIATKDGYLLHLKLHRPSTMNCGLLMSVSRDGKFIDWLVSDGALTGGNPHGDAYRQMDIDANGIITFIESSWGDNIESYSMNCDFTVAKEDDIKTDTKRGEFKFGKMCFNMQEN